MDIKRVAEELHPLERKILPFLKGTNEISALVKEAEVLEVEARRVLQWLEAKELVQTEKSTKLVVVLDENGKKYREHNLPENIFLKTILNESLTLNELNEKKILEKEEVMVSLGLLKSKSAILFENGKLSITEKGKEMLQKESPEQKFLKLNFPLDAETLLPEQKLC
jgi:predicted transcriptional regulator